MRQFALGLSRYAHYPPPVLTSLTRWLDDKGPSAGAEWARKCPAKAHFAPRRRAQSTATCCRANVANSWTSETKKHQAGRLLPDLTARSFEDDEITLKCKGDATVSSEPDGSILGLARQELSSGAAAISSLFFHSLFILPGCFFFVSFCSCCFFSARISDGCLAPSLVRYQ